ncbi:carotenoid biosynthesis protein [Pontibacter sp. FD36]|uniref:carotenoid biosynthesis protein n=1 Tax=Pontibacter sp. FD36 TaxID=2789860 RepID=UPI0018AC8742|nr:carotenoid biosynthesis protein [Pontibacter sp. FD36]MBF8963310.1 carotenoid biosynthesis protein [Pontibacter sp. FD36]
MPDTTQTYQPAIPLQERLKPYAFGIALGVLAIFHAVGFWGLMFSGEPEKFQRLTPMNLLLTNFLLFSFHRRWNVAFILFAVTIMAAGFFAEVLGIHTGLLFGDYAYGESLGIKVLDVPLLIGLNWLMLVYTSGHLVNTVQLHWLARAALAALLMVGLDFFLEPVAVAFDFWDWHGGHIPWSNYTGWLGLSFLFQVYFQKAPIYKHNRLAPYVYLVQAVFFISIWTLL